MLLHSYRDFDRLSGFWDGKVGLVRHRCNRRVPAMYHKCSSRGLTGREVGSRLAINLERGGNSYQETMSLELIHLRKLLKIMFSSPVQRVSELRADIRDEIAKEGGLASSGGDFYGPFWRDAKDHVFDVRDLHVSTEARIDSNRRRENLYPQLRDGFLLWWNDRRRWTNAPFTPADSVKGVCSFPSLGAVVKVDNILSVRDGQGQDHFVYPYFSFRPSLEEEAARLGLWLLIKTLPGVPEEEIRILDVIRGQTFSIDRYPLQGDEERIFTARFGALLNEWRKLWTEYE